VAEANEEIISFKTAGEWTVNELSVVLFVMNHLYNMLMILGHLGDYDRYFKSFPPPLEELMQGLMGPWFLSDGERLRVHSIHLSSPGVINLMGFELKGLKEILQWLFRRQPDPNIENMDQELKELVAWKQRIDVLWAVNYSEKQIRQILWPAQYGLLEMGKIIEKGKLVEVGEAANPPEV